MLLPKWRTMFLFLSLYFTLTNDAAEAKGKQISISFETFRLLIHHCFDVRKRANEVKVCELLVFKRLKTSQECCKSVPSSLLNQFYILYFPQSAVQFCQCMLVLASCVCMVFLKCYWNQTFIGWQKVQQYFARQVHIRFIHRQGTYPINVDGIPLKGDKYNLHNQHTYYELFT